MSGAGLPGAPMGGSGRVGGLEVPVSGAGGLGGAVAGSPPGNGPRPGLDDPLVLGPLRLRNRLVFTAHLTGFATDGLPTPRHTAYYAARAARAGLVITEEHSVLPDDRPYEKVIRGHDPAVVPRYRELTAAVHAHGSAVLAQLNHNGPQSSGMYSREPVRGPSAIPDPLFREVPVAMTETGLDAIVAGYAQVTRQCVAGGFDGVELQCSQASLLRCFLSPAMNQRADDHGGSLANRARLLLRVVAAVRAELGDRVLGVRLGVEPDDLPLADLVEVARMLEAAGGVTYLNTTTGVATASLYLVEPSMHTPEGYAEAVPTRLREAVGLPVIAVGRYPDAAAAERVLAAGHADLVGMARGLIAAPDLRTRACVGCNQECVGRVGLNRPLGCAVNPWAGREGVLLAMPVVRASLGADRRVGEIADAQPAVLGSGFVDEAPGAGRRAPRPGRASVAEVRRAARSGSEVTVVGGGPAGLRAAATAAARGHRVTLYERERLGGQLALAALAPGRGELARVVRDLVAECRAAGVRFVEDEYRPGAADGVIVLATGARPARRRPGSVDVRDVLDGTAAPTGRVVVVDELGFHHATSVAELLAARGAEVEIVTPAMVVGQDLGLTLDREGFRRRAHAAGIRLTTDRLVGEVSAGRVALVHHPTGRIEHREVDAVVEAVPADPDEALWVTLRDRDGVHRIGDCLAPRRMDAAIRDAEQLAVNL